MAGQGYGLLWRKFFDHEFWKEPRIFSKAEAWLDIVFCLSRFSNSHSGLKRGEFRASLTWLASRWVWDKAKVQRFMSYLTMGTDPMLSLLKSDGEGRVYRVCNYDKYQKPQQVAGTLSPHYADTPSDTPRETPRETPSETPKPAPLLVFPADGETPPDTPRETPSETPRDTNKEIKKELRNKKNTRAPSDGRHTGLIQFLFLRHQNIVIPPQDHRALKDFLTGTKSKEAYDIEHLKAYWEIFQADEFDRQQGASLGYFIRKINKFVGIYEKRNGNSGNSQRSEGATAAQGGLKPRPYTPKQ